MKSRRLITSAAAVVVMLALALLIALAPAAPAAAQNTACYRPVGGASFVCGDGGSFVAKDGATITVESGGTLDLDSGATFALDGYVTSDIDSLTVSGNAVVSGTTDLVGNATANGTLGVTGNTTLGGDALIAGDATISGTTGLIGNVDVTGNLEVVDHIANSGQTYYITGDAVTVTDGGTIAPAETLVELTAAGPVGAGLATASDGQLVILVNTANQTITITDTGTTRLAGDWAGGQYDTLTLIGQGTSWYELSRSVN